MEFRQVKEEENNETIWGKEGVTTHNIISKTRPCSLNHHQKKTFFFRPQRDLRKISLPYRSGRKNNSLFIRTMKILYVR